MVRAADHELGFEIQESVNKNGTAFLFKAGIIDA